MGLLTRLREWLAGGSSERDGEASEKGDPARSETDARTATEPTDEGRLDPEGVTETRSVATDDAVDKLQEVRGSGPAEAPTDATDADGDTKG